jgi:hypothetical protein
VCVLGIEPRVHMLSTDSTTAPYPQHCPFLKTTLSIVAGGEDYSHNILMGAYLPTWASRNFCAAEVWASPSSFQCLLLVGQEHTLYFTLSSDCGTWIWGMTLLGRAGKGTRAMGARLGFQGSGTRTFRATD